MGDTEETDRVGDKKAGSKKRLSVERIYQKKSQLEHILLRPDAYIGSVQPVTEKMWIFDEGMGGIVNKEVTYVPGLYKIFDEILVNAADNKQRDKKMDTIRVDINPEANQIKIYNNGKGIPVVHHQKENMYVPTMIFGHLLTSSNFNDEEEKVTGGRNGFGAKLCNVFSTKFTVETACKEYKKEFKQSWGANMSKAAEPKIKEFSGEDFTRVTFHPDLAKFKMESLDKDTVALLSRRAYDIAASARGIKVYLNGKRIPIKSFKDYVDLYLKGREDETGNQIKALHEVCGERWEVAVAVSDNGFQQMSFVNSIATTKGGRHIEHVSKLIENSFLDVLKKKNKSGVTIKPYQIRNHIWLFVNCLIVNPSFDSQTKENMTLQVNQFGSKCSLSDKFKTALGKCGIVDAVLAWSKFKQDQQLKNKHTAKKTNKLKGIAKLEDANDAGTRNSLDCTLILTEGDSAKTLAVAGLSVVGRDKYGVYPLRGKVLNVREASHKQIMENKEINEMVKIVGLQYKKKYASIDDLKTLRYGRVMIMTDQDQDGSHIKGLLINFIHHNWPGLLRLPFLEEFITPIVKASKGNNVVSFFSLPEFTEWKGKTDNWHTYKIKYYKGLGTSTSKEAKEYFSDMLKHRVKFHHNSEQDDFAINLAFSKKEVEQRKEWLKSWMEECKRRRELGLGEIYLYEKNTRSVSYSDFVNKELVLFSNLDNERSIPSLVDGFKPGQRKVMYTCFKRNDKREVKVAQLAGSVGEMSAYHHGEVSLMGTIINLAQDFVGSNNINLLLPIGQFGTRLAGGKDHASARYIFTQMSPLTRLIFNPKDDAVLKYLNDDNKKIEPEFYVPIIPMVLVNGADGIGTGWASKIPNYNPKEIIENLLALLDGKEVKDLKPMVPWYKEYKGVIEKLDDQRFAVSGEIAEISDTKVEITELPVKSWTQGYKESVMEVYLNGTEKQSPIIQDYKEYHTDKTVKFVVQMAADKLRQASAEKGFHQFFKLQTTISTSSMVLFDQLGALKKFDDVLDILKEFFDIRLEFYAKRKAYLEGMLGAEVQKLSNQARFIIEKCDNSLVVENKKKKVMIAELQRRNYDPDPVKKWKASLDQKEEEQSEADEVEDQQEMTGGDYDYLLGMPMWNLTAEKKEELLRKKDERHQELNLLRRTSKKEMWHNDLKELSKKIEEYEKQLAEEELAALSRGATKKDRFGGKGKKTMKTEALPSPHGIRVIPSIPEEMRKKAALAAATKIKKQGKSVARKLTEVTEEKDEFDMMIDNKDHNLSLSEKLGVGDSKERKRKKGASKTTDKRDKRNPWESASGSDSDANSIDDFEDQGDVKLDISDYGAPARDRPGRERKKVNYTFDKSSSDSGSDAMDDMKDNDGVAQDGPTTKKNGEAAKSKAVPPKKRSYEATKSDNDDSDSDCGAAPRKKAVPGPKPTATVDLGSNSDSEDNDSKFDNLFGTATNSNGKDAKKNGFEGAAKRSAFESGSDDGEERKPSQPPKKKLTKYKDSSDFEVDESDDEDFGPKKAAKGKKAAAPAKKASEAKKAPPKKTTAASKKLKNKFSDSDDDIVEASPPPKVQPKKKAPSKKLHTAALSDSDDGFDGKKKAKPAARKKTTAPKKKSAYGSDTSGDEMDFSSIKDYAPAQDRPGRQKKAVNYNFGGDSDSGDEF